MEYIIKIEKKPKKFIDKQDKASKERIYKALKELPNGDVKKMQAKHELYRLRVGEFRFIFKIIHNEIIINVIDADNRGEIYKKYKWADIS